MNSRLSPVRRIQQLLPLFFAALLITAASAQDVEVDFDRAVDFSKFKSYSWKVHPLLEKDPELLNSVGAELVRMDVNKEFLKRGLEPTDEEFADFYVTFFGSRHKSQEVSAVMSVSTGGWYNANSYWQSGWTKVMVNDYIEGTLVLDFVDAKTKQLAWRAYCKGAVRDPSKRDKVIGKALEKAFKKFPPKS